MTKIARTLALIVLAPVLFAWSVILSALVIVGSTVQGIVKIWTVPR